MLLVMDVGNTNTVLGIYDGDRLLASWRASTDQRKTSDEYGVFVLTLLSHRSIGYHMVEDIIISTVVPPLTDRLVRMCTSFFKITPMLVEPGIKTGMNILYDNPKEVGADRIVNAVAAINIYGTPTILVDFGTATTFCAVNENGDYMGGAIVPGLNIALEALFRSAAKLPRIELVKPCNVIGRNTVQSMQSGIFFSYVEMVNGMVKRFKKEMKRDPVVVATGGLANLIGTEARTIQHIDNDLTLKGLRIIHEMNREPKPAGPVRQPDPAPGRVRT